MATISLTNILGHASDSYDDVTGIASIKLPTGLTLDENVIKEIILKMETRAAGKRTDLNFPISQKAFADSPQYNFTARTNADASLSEVQVEYLPQLVLWLKATNPATSDAVNNND